MNPVTLWWQRRQAEPTLTVRLPWADRMQSLQNALQHRGDNSAAGHPQPAPVAPRPVQPHLPPGVALTVPDGVPPGWPYADRLPDDMHLCARSCGLWFATFDEAWAHGRNPETADACADLRRLRNAAYGRGAYQRMRVDPERSDQRRQTANEYRRDRYATDPEYRERRRGQKKEQARRKGQQNNHT